jgi:hypothetical protein
MAKLNNNKENIYVLTNKKQFGRIDFWILNRNCSKVPSQTLISLVFLRIEKEKEET